MPELIRSVVRAVVAAMLVAVVLASGARAQSGGFPPGSFDPQLAAQALQGDSFGVYSFADWLETPQGNDFWYAEAARTDSGQPVSPDAAAVLEAWIDAARVAETSDPPASFDAALANAALGGDAEALRTFVDWQETPHGVSFWSAQTRYVRDGRPLSGLAERSIQNWLVKSGG